MKSIYTKNDWYYEFRPALILAIGMIGLLNQNYTSFSGPFKGISAICGAVLIGSAFVIFKMRRDYRKDLL